MDIDDDTGIKQVEGSVPACMLCGMWQRVTAWPRSSAPVPRTYKCRLYDSVGGAYTRGRVPKHILQCPCVSGPFSHGGASPTAGQPYTAPAIPALPVSQRPSGLRSKSTAVMGQACHPYCARTLAAPAATAPAVAAPSLWRL